MTKLYNISKSIVWPNSEIIEDLANLRKVAPLTHCITNVVVTNYTANVLLAVGASPAMIYAIEEVLSGKIYLPIALSSRFFEYFQQSFREESSKQDSDEENLLSYLTQREEEVLELLTQGITYKGVANKLFISETTVKTHVNNIFQKLQVNDRTQAVLYAINNGFLSKKVKISA